MRTTKSAFAWVALVLVFGLVALATAQEQKVTPVTKIVFVNGAQYDGNVPVGFEAVAKAVREGHPEATFKVEGNVLRIGIQLPGVPRGQEVAVEWLSNCPVNSRFGYQEAEIIAKLDGLQPTLEAWTKALHPNLSGKVETYKRADGVAEGSWTRNDG